MLHWTLVFQNWDNEINKWLGAKVGVLAIDSGSKDAIDKNLGKAYQNHSCVLGYMKFQSRVGRDIFLSFQIFHGASGIGLDGGSQFSWCIIH